VEAELTRLLAEGWLVQELASGGAVPSVRADSINSVGKSLAQIGRQIAKSVYGGIER